MDREVSEEKWGRSEKLTFADAARPLAPLRLHILPLGVEVGRLRFPTATADIDASGLGVFGIVEVGRGGGVVSGVVDVGHDNSDDDKGGGVVIEWVDLW